MKKLILSILITLVSSYSFSQQNCLKDSIYNYKFISGTQVKDPTAKTIFKFDANNNRTEQLNQTWDTGNNTWVNDIKYSFTFDANNNQTGYLDQSWDAGNNAWVNNAKYNSTFDANNNQTKNLEQIWDTGDNAWVNNAKYNSTFDANNNHTEELIQVWDTGNNAWVNYNKYNLTFDANNNRTDSLNQTWDTGNNAWINNVSKTKSTYDSLNNQISSDNYSNWNSAGSYYDNHTRMEAYYHCITTGIKEFGQLSSFNVYPNPASNKITIQTKGNTKFTVYDISGRIVINSFDVKNSKQLSIADLEAGIYFLKAEGNAGTKKIVKQ